MPSAAAPANRPIAVTSSVRLTIPERGLGSTGGATLRFCA